MEDDCFFEVVLYDAKHWWNLFDIFNPLPHNGIGIRLDEDHFVTWTAHAVHKVKEKALAKRITWSEKKPIDYRTYYVGKVWLENSLMQHQEFESGKEFLSRYVGMMNGVKQWQTKSKI